MATLWVDGNESSTWDLEGAGEQVAVNAGATSYTMLTDAIVAIRVQVGNAAAPLQGGELIEVDVHLMNIETGDECLMPQIVMEVPAGVGKVILPCEPFPAKTGDQIKVFVKSSDANDEAVGGIVNMLLMGTS